MKQLTMILFCLVTLKGCELYEQDEYQEFYVVESYLVAGDTLPRVLLSTTTPIEEQYTFQGNAVSDAQVEVRMLAPDSTVRERYRYRLSDPGIFNPVRAARVRDEQLYQLLVYLPDGDSIEAKTYVPGNFQTLNKDELPGQYTYQGSQQIKVTTTPSSYITGRQTYYIFTINALDPDSTKLTPFYRDIVEEQDTDIENFYINSSGIINEKNYDRNTDGSITLTVPWIAIAFYDTNEVIANAIDDNMYNFLRSQDVQTGGPTLSPGEIQNIRYNINGGIGIFGSLASDTNRAEVIRP